MKLLPKIFISLALGFVLFAGVATFSEPDVTYACNQNDADRLFGAGGVGGILPWHYYLECDSGGVGVSSSIELNSLWLIALAVFESILFVGGIAAVVFIIWGGVKYITSQGNPEGTSTARKTIINAIAGLIITISASVVVAFAVNLLSGGNLNQGNALNVPGVAADDSFIRGLLDFVYATIAVVALIFVVIGSIKFATSAGDPQKAASARNTIIYAIVGLVVVLTASIITGFVLNEVDTPGGTPTSVERGALSGGIT